MLPSFGIQCDSLPRTWYHGIFRIVEIISGLCKNLQRAREVGLQDHFIVQILKIDSFARSQICIDQQFTSLLPAISVAL